MSKDIVEADKLRRQLLGSITGASDLAWARVSLDGGATIEVSYPYMTNDLWVPVSAQEQWALAVRMKAYPLTRAVADQAHLNADKGGGAVSYKSWTNLYDFEGFSKYLNDHSNYDTFYSWQSISGSHKLWLLSNGPGGDPKGHAVNYGFYTKIKSKKEGDGGGDDGGKYLKGWYVVQTLGSHHDKLWWDYSQLLQFMRNYTVGGEVTDLRAALLNGDAALWDEASKLRKELLPF